MLRDNTGRAEGDPFLNLVRREARARGAEGAWILGIQRHSQVGFQGSTTNPVRGGPHDRRPTGSMQTTIGLVRVLLFNYARETEPSSPRGKRGR